MSIILTQHFFNRPAPTVARDLLGKYLVRRSGQKEIALMVTETEAYEGFYDKASHASRGKTARNAPMFGEAGIFYVYLCYGMYWMLNVVTGKKGYPAAVLIRGVSPHTFHRVVPVGMERAKRNAIKGVGVKGERGLHGPGRLTKYLAIDKRFNNQPASIKTGLWFEDRGIRLSPRDIQKTPRIGVAYAGEKWASKRWRFIVKTQTTNCTKHKQNKKYKLPKT